MKTVWADFCDNGIKCYFSAPNVVVKKHFDFFLLFHLNSWNLIIHRSVLIPTLLLLPLLHSCCCFVIIFLENFWNIFYYFVTNFVRTELSAMSSLVGWGWMKSWVFNIFHHHHCPCHHFHPDIVYALLISFDLLTYSYFTLELTLIFFFSQHNLKKAFWEF